MRVVKDDNGYQLHMDRHEAKLVETALGLFLALTRCTSNTGALTLGKGAQALGEKLAEDEHS